MDYNEEDEEKGLAFNDKWVNRTQSSIDDEVAAAIFRGVCYGSFVSIVIFLVGLAIVYH